MRRKNAKVTTGLEHGPHLLRERHGVDLQYVVGRLAQHATCEQQLRALVAFAVAVGDEGYADVFRERLAQAAPSAAEKKP